jgi:predicted phage terminase large subunit-like protein
VLEGAPGSNCRIVVAAPPQHGKTVLTSHALVQWLARSSKHWAYATYTQDRSDNAARSVRLIAEEAGLEPQGTVREWRVNTGAHIKFTSIGGSLTGFPLDGGLVIDDPIKDREEAESKRRRDRCWDWLQDVGLTRLHPGAPVILMATRWHIDDLSGRCIKAGWRYLNLRAIAGDDDPLGRAPGDVLWPSQRPLSSLEEHRANAYKWASLYQGEPRPRGGAVFGDPARYTELPKEGFRRTYGADLAYSGKTASDWSILVELLRVGSDPKTALYYVANVLRRQMQAPQFGALCKAELDARPGPALWYASGTEAAAGQYLQRDGVKLTIRAPKGDKFTRAIPLAAAWNDGRVLVPDSAPWLSDYLDVMTGFTGVNDAHDDDVDATAAGFDLLALPSGGFAPVTISN